MSGIEPGTPCTIIRSLPVTHSPSPIRAIYVYKGATYPMEHSYRNVHRVTVTVLPRLEEYIYSSLQELPPFSPYLLWNFMRIQILAKCPVAKCSAFLFSPQDQHTQPLQVLPANQLSICKQRVQLNIPAISGQMGNQYTTILPHISKLTFVHN